jgi:hypothetical protein
MATYNNNFRVKQTVSKRLILSCVVCVIGLVSLFFLFAPGIVFTYTNSGKTISETVGELVFGGYYTGMNAGLMSAFFIAIAASLISLATGGFRYAGYLAALMFITCAVLFFCCMPLIGDGLEKFGSRGSFSLGCGTYLVGISQIICAILLIVAAKCE